MRKSTTIRVLSGPIAGLALIAASPAYASLEVGTPSDGPANPLPRFGTLISFDDGTTGTSLAANAYAGVGVTSITNTLGPQLGYYATSQSIPNYIGSGPSVGWNADILVTFANLQAAVGIGIAGPTTLRFELLGAAMNVLEGYNLTTTPSNTYYYINRVSADVSYLRVAGNFVAIDDLQFDSRTVPPQGVPEPATWLMMLIGFGAIGVALRRGNPRQLANVTP
jgi:hypothetical protein